MYKLIGTKAGETPDEAIVRCANNLVKAVLASGRSIHSTPGVSSVDVHFYDHLPTEIYIENVLSGWRVTGRTPLKITFRPADEALKQDDAEEEHE